MTRPLRRILALTGGVGGAKLALGLANVLQPGQVTFLVNTGDDFDHLGLRICPDIDTLLYTLSDEANPETGWGRRNETWHCLEALDQLGGETWFRLGDRDLATHLTRTLALARGESLTAVTASLASHLGIPHPVLPMTDQPVATMIGTAQGELAFQQYFVRDRCAPAVTGFRFAGSEQAGINPQIEALLAAPDLDGIVICPSNPFVSVDPILTLPGMRAALAAASAPVVAVSPIIQGAAVKGPTAKMMAELGVPQDALAVARHYGDLLDGFILDSHDASLVEAVQSLGMDAIATPTLMLTLQDKMNLALATLDFISHIVTSNAP
ncbi:MAG: 2-phospho-L-lactate transferase [Gammaproteobacteria bacterium]|nr:2-phospho-L-lactate transferase [Gammaproteobacteria bacterium]